MDPIVHESYYSPLPNSNDIALLKLVEKVDLNIYSLACLPALNNEFTGKTGSVYGERLVMLKSNPGIHSIVAQTNPDQLKTNKIITCQSGEQSSHIGDIHFFQ